MLKKSYLCASSPGLMRFSLMTTTLSFLWAIYTIITFSIVLFLMFQLSIENVNSIQKGNNEITQDNLGDIQRFFYKAQFFLNTKQLDGKFNDTLSFVKVSEDLLKIPRPVPREDNSWIGNIYVQKQETLGGEIKKLNGAIITWRENLFFAYNYERERRGINNYFDYWRFFYKTAMFFVLGHCLLTMLIMCCKPSRSRIDFVISMPILIILLTFIPILITYYIPDFKNHKDKLISFIVEKNHQEEFQKILNNAQIVSSCQAPSFLNNKGIKSIFVSKRPFFPYNYIRINLDSFNYLFFSLEAKEIEKINPLLEYNNLNNGFFLGTYVNYNNLSQQNYNIVFLYCIATWLILIASSIIIIYWHSGQTPGIRAGHSGRAFGSDPVKSDSSSLKK